MRGDWGRGVGRGVTGMCAGGAECVIPSPGTPHHLLSSPVHVCIRGSRSAESSRLRRVPPVSTPCPRNKIAHNPFAPQRSHPSSPLHPMSSPVVVITGASRGIGLALVQAYAAAGHRVVAIVRKATPELSAVLPTTQIVEGVDFNVPDATGKVVTALGTTPVSILVNNAVRSHDSPLPPPRPLCVRSPAHLVHVVDCLFSPCVCCCVRVAGGPEVGEVQ